ncbi:hypothetical protein CLF_109813 [Clonorchis sinensis]|uniref:SAM domain-containing protein n=1 Tax=Clonorchis sinensis TaxID=79923 RepID=G7YSY2_CLOSI|nr:hypothetical protein CLF_109813 [Clonorchis sinensis]
MGDLSHIYDVCLSTTIPNASTWTVDDVCQWITDLGFPYYKVNFISPGRFTSPQFPGLHVTKLC